MIDFEKIYESLSHELAGNQKRIPLDSVVAVYFGLSSEGYFRLSFMSSIPAPKLESTKTLRIEQGAESDSVYWTCFDLLQPEAQKVYFTFCGNLIDAIVGEKNEATALATIKKRYLSWKSMFRRDASKGYSKEILQGLYGELYFFKTYMIDMYGADRAVESWGGPDAKSKDFSIDDTWYEIKTIGANATEVHISSLAQLSSPYVGHLVIIRAEAMADAFEGESSSIGALFKDILSKIKDEKLESIFLNKLATFGFDISDQAFEAKFVIKSVNIYKVDKDFPRLTENDVAHTEIGSVQYSLIVNSLKKYMED